MAAETSEGTLAPGEAHAEPGLPQMNAETFAGQIFWLVVTFGILMLVMNRIAIPNIRGGIERRKGQIAGDLGAAEDLHRKAEESEKAYDASLAAARSRALALAEENRKRVMADVEAQKAQAEATALASFAEAENSISAMRRSAAERVQSAAAEATAEIVERLIGERVDTSSVARALGSGA